MKQNFFSELYRTRLYLRSVGPGWREQAKLASGTLLGNEGGFAPSSPVGYTARIMKKNRVPVKEKFKIGGGTQLRKLAAVHKMN